MSAVSQPASRKQIRHRLSPDDWLMGAGLCVMVVFLAAFVAGPLVSLLSKSFEDVDGAWVGLANFIAYFSNEALVISMWNSIWVSLLATIIVIPLAFTYAYALTRSTIPGKSVFRALALIPILAPSLLPALSLVYLFGNKGMLSALIGGSIYGSAGIVVAQVFYCFPFALMILVTALGAADARLYEAAQVLGASPLRVFFTVTLPGAKYGLVSAAFVVFTLVITDFGIPKVIGGNFNVMAIDVYKKVIGQQNFQMGAVVGLLLLAPAILSFFVDRWVQKRQMAVLSARAVPLQPKARPGVDRALFGFCVVLALLIMGIVGTAIWGSTIKFWPYNLSPTLANYDFDEFDGAGWTSFFNSIRLAAWTALIGTIVVFVGAWLVEKSRSLGLLRGVVQFLAMLPLAVPGLVLGLSYIFFFNAPANPLNFLYGTLAIMVLNSLAHFYTVAHLTGVTALKQIDPEFESVSQSLKVPLARTFLRVSVPVCMPAILDIAIYLFVNAMTTVSAVIFLYNADTKPASVAVINMNDAGQVAAAAAMATMIFLTSAVVRGLHGIGSSWLLAKTQAWRKR